MDLFLFKQKTAYVMRISDWSSDVCSSDLGVCGLATCFPHDGQARCAGACRKGVTVGGLGVRVDQFTGSGQVAGNACGQLLGQSTQRSAEPGVWQECVTTCRSRCSP